MISVCELRHGGPHRKLHEEGKNSVETGAAAVGEQENSSQEAAEVRVTVGNSYSAFALTAGA